MSRLPRPHIPLAVRVQVAERQCHERGASIDGMIVKPLRNQLEVLLFRLFGISPVELHHRPALTNRKNIMKNGAIIAYDPPANDSRFLVYLLEDEHDVETRVRGLHGQHSDLGLARKNKRIAKNHDPKHRRVKIKSRGFQKGRKRKWPKRKFGQ